MNRQANILFTGSSFESRGVTLNGSLITNSYSQTVYGLLTRASYTQTGRHLLGRQLISLVEHALAFKQTEAAEQIVQVMLGLEISNQFHGVARYYEAMCLCRRGDLDGARQTAQLTVETATPAYRARALQCIGGSYHSQGNIDEATSFYFAAGKVAADCDLVTIVQSQKMLAVVRSIYGDHKRALEDLENLSPLVRIASKQHATIYLDYLNSLAIELGEVGRIDEAHRALDIALASPLARVYPECNETKAELKAKRTAATSSVVAITRAPEVEKPEIEESETVQLVKPKPRLAKSRSLIWLQLTTNSPPKKRPAVSSADSHPLTTFALDRLGDSIKPRAPPSRI